jgi:outer membrane protein assembly factor BamD
VAAGGALIRRLATAALLASIVGGCAGRNIDLEKLSSPSDEIVWQAGQKAVEDKDWTSARQYFRRIIDAFPQSQHQPDARIALADTYMKDGGPGNYVLAVSSYREFLTLYPSHPRSAYAQFQAAEAYYRQMNSPDRDQTATRQALDEYQRLLDLYPDSDQVELARERIHDCRQTLARSAFMVGYFYQRTRKAYRAAVARYEDILRNYPDYEQLDEVLYRLGEVLATVTRYAEARPHLARLIEEYPSSPFVDDATKLLAKMPPVLPSAPASAADAPATPQIAPPGPPTEAGPQPTPHEGPALKNPPQV